MADVASVPACQLRTECGSCLQFEHCIYIILLHNLGMGECVDVESARGNRQVKTIIYDKKDCSGSVDGFSPNIPAFGFDSDSDLRLGAKRPWAMPIEQQIREWKFSNFYLDQHPLGENRNTQNYQQTLIINAILRLSYEPNDELVDIYGDLELDWNDPRTSWDPLEIPNSNVTLTYTSEELWYPILGIKGYKSNLVDDSTMIKVDYSGKVKLRLSFFLPNSCQVDATSWPYDSFHCNFTLLLESGNGKNLYALFTSGEQHKDLTIISSPYDLLDASISKFSSEATPTPDHEKHKTLEFPIVFSIRKHLSFFEQFLMLPLSLSQL